MSLNTLKDRPEISGEVKLDRLYAQFKQLLGEIAKKEISQSVLNQINTEIEEVNHSVLTGTHLARLVKRKQTNILKILEKEHKITPKNHYRTLWMVLGMSGIGMPIGAAIGSAVGNIGLLAVGMPIGMAIGLILGANMDKKALAAGRQMDIEIKY